MANEFEDYNSYSGTIVKSSSNWYDTVYTRAAVAVNNDTTSYLQGNFGTAVSSFWFTCRVGCYNTSASCTPITFVDNGVDRLRVRFGAQGSTSALTTLSLYRWDGTTETLLGTLSNAFLTYAMNRLDFKVVYSGTGSVEVYRNGTLMGTVTGDLIGSSGSTTLNGVRLKAGGLQGLPTDYTEAVAHTGSTLGMRLKTLAPDAAGSFTAWTGTYQNVDEVAATDTDVINSATAGQEWSCNVTGLPAGSSGTKVRAVKVSCEAAKGDSGPSAIGIGIRSGSTTVYQSDQACSLAYTSMHSANLETNPVTGQPWTTTELADLQIAFRSA
jgi:hypothetical protein